MNRTNFKDDIQKGKIGENIFKEDFIEFLNINYIDVTGCQQFQIIDADFLSKIGLYEIKCNYKDNKQIIIEEYTNINKNLGNISYGWFYKSKADLIVFISKITRAMIMIPFTNNFKNKYECIKNNHRLIKNKISYYKNNKWQSAFRIIKLDSINGFFSYYKRVKEQ